MLKSRLELVEQYKRCRQSVRLDDMRKEASEWSADIQEKHREEVLEVAKSILPKLDVTEAHVMASLIALASKSSR